MRQYKNPKAKASLKYGGSNATANSKPPTAQNAFAKREAMRLTALEGEACYGIEIKKKHVSTRFGQKPPSVPTFPSSLIRNSSSSAYR